MLNMNPPRSQFVQPKYRFPTVHPSDTLHVIICKCTLLHSLGLQGHIPQGALRQERRDVGYDGANEMGGLLRLSNVHARTCACVSPDQPTLI